MGDGALVCELFVLFFPRWRRSKKRGTSPCRSATFRPAADSMTLGDWGWIRGQPEAPKNRLVTAEPGGV